MTIRGLIEIVESGKWPDGLWIPAPFTDKPETGLLVQDAFHGSLDAAKALHDALLPGWWAMLRHSTRPMVTVGDIDAVQEAQDDSLSRAWLLAILRALEGDA
ncbi:MAG: hypothetical protein ING26_19145 [Roseomonas sp.]|nr:hypothetical protein [Roseomonas sp.]